MMCSGFISYFIHAKIIMYEAEYGKLSNNNIFGFVMEY